MSSRSEFVDYINQYEAALSLPDVTVSSLSRYHASKILRNGLAVSGFCALEDFLKRRAQEFWLDVQSNQVDFNNLPLKIQALVTFKLFYVLSNKAQHEYESNDLAGKISFAQTHAEYIASTRAGEGFTISEYAFGFENSNLKENQVSELLKSLQVKSGWEVMTQLTQALGTAAMSLNNAYISAMSLRHKAAHEASSDSPVTDLQNFRRVGAAIAFTYDVILTECTRRIVNGNGHYLQGGFLEVRDFAFYYIVPVESYWKIFLSSSSSRAKARCRSSDEAWDKVSNLPRAQEILTVELDRQHRIVDWRSC
ncbi:hypothetical protein J8402_05115 [Chromohalobacter israelensis]|uniref:hypothetical protein n=1 Tax=Chromohalobacter israelensis TaxID=141390 RepID=UPI003AF6B219